MKDYLEKVDYTKPEHKAKMNDLFYMAICDLKESNKELYDHIKCEIYEMIYGKKISDDMADEWVADMKPLAKWTREDVTKVLSSKGITMPINDAYVLMNMLYSDSSNIYGNGDTPESIDKYIQGVKDFYFDEDLSIGGEEKLYNYHKYIYDAK